MKTGKHLLRLVCILSVFTICLFCTNRYGVEQNPKDATQARTDLIKINIMNKFGELEKPPVEFLHDAHTKALAGKNKDCTTCHLTRDNLIFPKFERIKDTDRLTVMNIYHKKCIACHGKMKLAHEKAGPVECDGCHKEKERYSSVIQPMGFDKSLHYRHLQAEQKKCELCHHEYNKKEKKLFYAKGKEGTCRYCHETKIKDNVLSMHTASHIECINCHLKTISKNMSAGPVNCYGCHDKSAQRKIKKIYSVPRMEMNQPDMVLIKSNQKSFDTGIANQDRMNFVPFDHKAHEAYNDTCRVCHHDTLKSCNECHTLAGTKKGKEVNLEDAMHCLEVSESCIGCHAKKMEDKNCAGCHAFMGRTHKKKDDSCLKCHMMPIPEKEKTLTPDEEKVMAAEMLTARSNVTAAYHVEDIPETVVIKTLSKKYEAVDFPHRKIVNALLNNIKDNKLAQYFHGQDGNICKGCHHYSPVSKKPPRCESCHGKPFDAKNLLKPGILGAFHQQCMGCHLVMGIKKPYGCTDCHKKKEYKVSDVN